MTQHTDFRHEDAPYVPTSKSGYSAGWSLALVALTAAAALLLYFGYATSPTTEGLVTTEQSAPPAPDANAVQATPPAAEAPVVEPPAAPAQPVAPAN